MRQLSNHVLRVTLPSGNLGHGDLPMRADAKAAISELVSSGGLRVVDSGPLQRARQLEALGLLHMALQFTLNTGFGSAVKIDA